MKLMIYVKKILLDVYLGDSIVVNGICLIVISFIIILFIVDVMFEMM